MFSLTILDLSSYLGLGAVAAISLNLLLGLLMALRYSPTRLWPHRHVNLFAVHRWTAYIAAILILSHPVVLLFARSVHFRWFDILFPVHSPLQPIVNSLGALSLYLLAIVLLTSLLRHRMARPVWRRTHFLVFPSTILLFLHSILVDPDVRTGKPDWLDGGKIFLYIALTLISFASAARFRLRVRGLRPVPLAGAATRPLQPL